MATGIVLGLSGRIASGKSFVANYLELHYEFRVLRYRALLTQILEERGVFVNRSSLQAVGHELGEKLGYDGITEMLLAGTEASINYVVDGVRQLSALRYLQERYVDRFALIFRDVDEVRRLHLHNQRAKNSKPLTLQEFRLMDLAPVEREIPELLSKADLVLPYTADPAELQLQIDMFMLCRFGLRSS